MRIPSNNDCVAMVKEINEQCKDELNAWEAGFIRSNLGQDVFTLAQKQVLLEFAKKYELKSFAT